MSSYPNTPPTLSDFIIDGMTLVCEFCGWDHEAHANVLESLIRLAAQHSAVCVDERKAKS